MPKTLAIIIVVVVILLIGGAAFMMLNKPAPDSAQKQTTVVEQTVKPESTTAPTKGSILSLLTSGKSITCTITYADQKGAQGTIYVSGSKMRGDFTTTVADKPIMSHMISMDQTAYLWTDGSKQGTKMKAEASQSATYSAPSGQPKPVDLNTQVEQNCSPWIVDNSKFVLPTDVQFADLSQMMKNLPNSSGMPKMDKSLCNNISDPKAKAACLKAF